MTDNTDDRSSLVPGLAAVALFGVLAVVFARASFGDPAGFAAGESVTASIGYALINVQHPDAIPSEGFLVAFLVIAVVLDAALDGAVLLARRDEAGEITTALRSSAADEETAGQPVAAADGGVVESDGSEEVTG